jgi:hypothetical protein
LKNLRFITSFPCCYFLDFIAKWQIAELSPGFHAGMWTSDFRDEEPDMSATRRDFQFEGVVKVQKEMTAKDSSRD